MYEERGLSFTEICGLYVDRHDTLIREHSHYPLPHPHPAASCKERQEAWSWGGHGLVMGRQLQPGNCVGFGQRLLPAGDGPAEAREA